MGVDGGELGEVGNDTSPCRVFVQGIEISQRSGQAGVVAVRPVINDVHVKGGDRNAFEDGGDATDDDELDLMPKQNGENVEKSKLVVHGAAL